MCYLVRPRIVQVLTTALIAGTVKYHFHRSGKGIPTDGINAGQV